MKLRTLFVASLVVATAACDGGEENQVIDAPEELDDLAKFFWNVHNGGTDEEIAAGLDNLGPLVEDLSKDGSKVGIIDYLDDSDIAWLDDLEGERDIKEALGFFIANKFECDMQTLREIAASPRQDEIHPGVYDTYERVFDDDDQPWIDSDVDELTWTTTYRATPVTEQYTAVVKSRSRHPTSLDTEALVQATWLPSPATWDGDSSEFSQDYQSDIYFDAGGGDIYHFNSIWRYMALGVFDVNTETYQAIYVDGLRQWDEQTAAACASWPDIPDAN